MHRGNGTIVNGILIMPCKIQGQVVLLSHSTVREEVALPERIARGHRAGSWSLEWTLFRMRNAQCRSPLPHLHHHLDFNTSFALL